MTIHRPAKPTYVATALALAGLAALVVYARRLARGGAPPELPVSLTTSIRIDATPAEVFAAWIDAAREPRFMQHTELLHYDLGECVWWRSRGGSGSVFFLVGADGHGTDAAIELRGRSGDETVAELLRFKQRVEGTREPAAEGEVR